MSKREIAVLVVRIIAIQVFLDSLARFERFTVQSVHVFDMARTASPTAVWSVGGIDRGNMWLMLGTNLVIVSFWFLFTICLWLGAPRLSESLVQEYAGDPPLDMHGLDVPRLVFSLLGAYLLVQTIPAWLSSTLSWIYHQVRWTSNPAIGSAIALPVRSFNWYESIRLLLALWLTFGTRGIVGIIYKAREWANHTRAPKTSPDS
jgi:hypothetical protein